mmetsp:Transcript_3891/g.6390  ORF Transcript_3891/g.6390 Transcript_3891/m.6390 type:complete len:127 (-) Transcript_3891:617-997(-)
MVRLLDTAMAKVETLENELRMKNESHQALKDEMDGTKSDLGHVKGILEEEQRTNRETNRKLLEADEKVKALQKEAVVWNGLNATLQQERDILQLELDSKTRTRTRKKIYFNPTLHPIICGKNFSSP